MKRTLSPSPHNELEVEIVKYFVLPERQERLLLFQARRRKEFIEAFHTEKYLNPAVTIRVTSSTDVFALMRKLGASEEGYAVSGQKELDTRTLPLNEALELCVGSSIETVLISPGTLIGYYEGGGYTNQYVLVGGKRGV